jgi:hypothetical protein
LSSALYAEARDVEMSDNLVYAIFTSGLNIIDINDPGDPHTLGFYFFQEAPVDLRIVDGLAVVADSSAGIHVLNITDPANPIFRGAYPTDSTTFADARGLDLVGDDLFVANGSAGLLVLSLTDPDNPDMLSELNRVAPSWSIDVQGDYAFIAALQNGIQVVDISDPSNPVYVDGLSANPYLVGSRDIRVNDSYAYVADNFGLATVNIENPESLVLTSYIPTNGRALDLYIEDSCLYLADDLSGFHVFEILQTPAQPRWLSFFDTPDDAKGIAAEGEVAAVADDYTGFMVFDVSDPSVPESLGTYLSAGQSRGGVLEGDLAYIAQGSMGVAILNIEDPARPDTVSCFNENISFVHSLDVSGGLMAIANGFNGLMIVDVSDPFLPSFLGDVATGKQLVEVKIVGNYAFVVDGDFHAVDLSVPSSPVILSSFDTSDAMSGDLALAGNLAFVADYSEGVSSFDISSPADSLLLLDRLDTDGYAVGIEARDGLVHLADDLGGFRILSYDETGQLEEVSQVDLDDPTINVALDDDVVFLALNRGEIVAVDIGDPYSPGVLGRFRTPGQSVAVEAESSLVMVGDKSSTIFLEFQPHSGVKREPPVAPVLPRGAFSLRQNYPNPFNPSTVITFRVPELDEASRIESTLHLEVYNLRGRFVKAIYRGPAGDGEHVVTWDGTNARGEPVPSGIYLYVLKIGDLNLARKMLLVR